MNYQIANGKYFDCLVRSFEIQRVCKKQTGKWVKKSANPARVEPLAIVVV
jgi:hypothetical protein